MQRHAPDLVVDVAPRLRDAGGHLFVVGEHRGQVGAQGDACRAGEGREVDHQVRLVRGAVRQRVAQHDPPLRIGVLDLDGQALAGRDHVAGAIGIAGDRVLHRRHQQAQPHRQPGGHDQIGEPDGMGRSAHVLLHQPHPARGLDVEPAGVEAHSFSHQGQAGGVRLAPGQVDEPRAMDARASHRMDRRVALVEQRLSGHHPQLRAVPGGQIGHRGGKILRHHVVRRGVDEVADAGHRSGLHARRLGRRYGAGEEPRGRWRRLPVPLEAVRGEGPAERGPFEPA